MREAVASEETLLILVRDTVGAASAATGMTVRTLGAADAALYAEVIGTDSAASFNARLSPSSRCFVVEDGERLLHASWVTTECAWTREIRAYMCVSEGAAYVYESFTHPDARGRGVYPFALNAICHDLSERGVARLWVAVEAHNEPSLRAVAKAGFEAGLEISYRRRLGRLAVLLPEQVKTDRNGGRGGKKVRIWLPGDGGMEQGKP